MGDGYIAWGLEFRGKIQGIAFAGACIHFPSSTYSSVRSCAFGDPSPHSPPNLWSLCMKAAPHLFEEATLAGRCDRQLRTMEDAMLRDGWDLGLGLIGAR